MTPNPSKSLNSLPVNTCCITHVTSYKTANPSAAPVQKNPRSYWSLPAARNTSSMNSKNAWLSKKKLLPTTLKRTLFSHNADCCINNSNKPAIPRKIKEKTENTQHIVPFTPFEESNHDDCAEKTNALLFLRLFDRHYFAFLRVQVGRNAHYTYFIIPKIRTQVCNKDVKYTQRNPKVLF